MILDPISPQSLPPGTRIEEFVIERVLGSGGFGITYLAMDTALGRQVVIKENLPVQFCFRDPHSLTVAPRHTTGEDAENFQWSLENFAREAAMLASLQHPGIVQVLRSFQAFGTAYFVMPFVDGMALDDLMRKRGGDRFSEEELRGLISHVLKALAHLHDRGIYHRDIKPGNILITSEGAPVLIDFGSARQRLSERSMTVVESAGYTPFEQLQSRGNVGPWSDLYALGGTLVKAITGEALPKANDRVFDDPWKALVSRNELLPAFSVPFLDSIDRALCLHPRDRWQEAGEWLAALGAPTEVRRQPIQTIEPEPFSEPEPAFFAVDSLPAEQALAGAAVDAQSEEEFDLITGCKIPMCWVPPGEFLMGSPEGEYGAREDETQHSVKISRGFWMGKYPVTQAQWLAVMESHPSALIRLNLKTRMNPEKYYKELARWANHPVECVNWHDIRGSGRSGGDFLGKINARSHERWSFDLPTEAEWEYACQAGESSQAERELATDLGAVAWYADNSEGSTHRVGLKQPNDWGLHDMLGNVWEWCSDWYGAYDGAYASRAVMDPQGPKSGTCRVLRGGSWKNDALRCRIACRDYNYPEHANDGLGFRLVLRSGH